MLVDSVPHVEYVLSGTKRNICDKQLAAISPAWGLSHFCVALGGSPSPSDTFVSMLGSLVGA